MIVIAIPIVLGEAICFAVYLNNNYSFRGV